jgi:hypothetical protein
MLYLYFHALALPSQVVLWTERATVFSSFPCAPKSIDSPARRTNLPHDGSYKRAATQSHTAVRVGGEHDGIYFGVFSRTGHSDTFRPGQNSDCHGARSKHLTGTLVKYYRGKVRGYKTRARVHEPPRQLPANFRLSERDFCATGTGTRQARRAQQGCVLRIYYYPHYYSKNYHTETSLRSCTQKPLPRKTQP